MRYIQSEKNPLWVGKISDDSDTPDGFLEIDYETYNRIIAMSAKTLMLDDVEESAD